MQVKARKAVVTNASLWDAQQLLPNKRFPGGFERKVDELPANRSFMHLHLGFDATGLDGLEMHHIVVNSWEGGVRSAAACRHHLPTHILCTPHRCQLRSVAGAVTALWPAHDKPTPQLWQVFGLQSSSSCQLTASLPVCVHR